VDAFDELSVVAVNGEAAGVGQLVATAHGIVTLHADGTFTYTPGLNGGATGDSFTYTISDGHGGTHTATVTISIDQYSGVLPVEDGILRVGGGSGADVIVVSGGNLIVNGVSHALAGVTELRIWARNGNDIIYLSGLTVKSFVHGGNGNDIVTGGNADDVIFGGMGDDQLTGASGNDFLIAGDGKDRIVGSSGHDILVAADVECYLDLVILRQISQDWASSRTVDADATDDALDEALLSDDYNDQLTGSSGADLFIISSGDRITDYHFGRPSTNRDGDVVIKDGTVM
jgi:Ca2+-binding RTX toxin-like protein